MDVAIYRLNIWSAEIKISLVEAAMKAAVAAGSQLL